MREIKQKKKAPTDAISRRGLLTSAAFVPVAALVRPQEVEAQNAAAPSLDANMRGTLAAFVDRIVPLDGTGPGAIDCGVAEYIERALGEFLAPEKAALVKALSEIDAYAVKTHGGAYRGLAAEKRDAVIAAMEKNEATGIEPDGRTVFLRLRQLTVEGMFSDPYYGGNKAFAGWDLLRYPGARLASAAEDQKLKEMPKPVRRSAYGAAYGH
jgi:gluconate 2-dehydrogenase gamma chain